MKYLLDTHIFVWFIEDNKRLHKSFRDIISNSEDVYISVATIWEIIIKEDSGKLRLKTSIEKMVDDYKFGILDIGIEHVLAVRQLPSIHKDPFDRIIVAQTKVEDLVLLTADKKVKSYFD